MRARVELLLPNTSIVVCSRSSSTLSKFWRLLLRLLEAAAAIAASTVVSRRGRRQPLLPFFLESKVKGPRYTSAPGTSLSVGSKRRLGGFIVHHHMEETDGRPRCENRCRGWMWPHHHHHRRPKALLTRSVSDYVLGTSGSSQWTQMLKIVQKSNCNDCIMSKAELTYHLTRP